MEGRTGFAREEGHMRPKGGDASRNRPAAGRWGGACPCLPSFGSRVLALPLKRKAPVMEGTAPSVEGHALFLEG